MLCYSIIEMCNTCNMITYRNYSKFVNWFVVFLKHYIVYSTLKPLQLSCNIMASCPVILKTPQYCLATFNIAGLLAFCPGILKLARQDLPIMFSFMINMPMFAKFVLI